MDIQHSTLYRADAAVQHPSECNRWKFEGRCHDIVDDAIADLALSKSAVPRSYTQTLPSRSIIPSQTVVTDVATWLGGDGQVVVLCDSSSNTKVFSDDICRRVSE